MKVKILRSIATSSRAYTAGSVVDIDQTLAKAWIDARIVQAIEEVDNKEKKHVSTHGSSKRKSSHSRRG